MIAIEDLKRRIDDLIEMEARSGSMDPALITPEYVYRMLGARYVLNLWDYDGLSLFCRLCDDDRSGILSRLSI